jgi:tRNA threonylcarbamoyladenosine biosynthesis protein TsaE
VSTSKFISDSEEHTRQFAAEFAKSLHGDEKICLIGPLGAGKTTFVRGFVEGFGIPAKQVASPTFTLVREYGPNPTIFHIDMYRFDKEEEIFEAGIYDLLTSDNLVLIEWADRLQKYYPDESILIRFSHIDEKSRLIEIDRE